MSAISAKLYTAGQVRRLDACAIQDHDIDGYQLMERAAKAVFAAARQRYPHAHAWLVLCGAGNNGGDGYVIARLAREAGLAVTLYALKPDSDLQGDAALAARDWRRCGGETRQWPPGEDNRFDLVIDALLGTGLDREVTGHYRAAIEFANRQDAPVLAVDIPSGLHADTGRVMGAAIDADLTVTFIGLKQGLFTLDGPDHCGRVLFDDLATPAVIHDSVPGSGTLIRENFIGKSLPARRRNTHKGHFGHVLVVGGAPGMSGAVVLAGEAALRTGAGLVSVATHAAHAASLNLSRPELMVSAIAAPEDLEALIDRASVLAIGPGLGGDAWAERHFRACLAANLPVVLDADGLNLLAAQPEPRGNWVLTPHPAEAARLLDQDTSAVQADRVAAARALAARYNANVILKGCGTVVANASGRFAICPLGNPGMATAGSGDVLTGVVAGLLAQGLEGWLATQAAVVAHAAAGDLAARNTGERGLIATDITALLPRVLNP